MDPFPTDPLLRAEATIAFIKDANGITYTYFLALGLFVGDWATQAMREVDMLRHPKPATYAYFATRIFATATLLVGCLVVSMGGNTEANARGTIVSFFVFESCALSCVQLILLYRTLALWNGYTKVRWCATVGWFLCSACHFVKLYAYAAIKNPLGIWIIYAKAPVGGKLRVVPYFLALLFATCMTGLTLLGAQRQTVNRSTQELLRLQPGRGATKRREFIASRILRGQILYYVVMVVSTGATALLTLFDALKGYNQFIPIPLNVVLTCSAACNIVLSMRSPIKGSLDVDHGLSLLPAGHHRVEIDVETDQAPAYIPTPELRSSSSPSLQKEGMAAYHPTKDSLTVAELSRTESQSQTTNEKDASPIEDPFWGSDAISSEQSGSPRAADNISRTSAIMPHLGRNDSSSQIPFQGGEELPDVAGLQIQRNIVTRFE